MKNIDNYFDNKADSLLRLQLIAKEGKRKVIID